MASMGQQQTFHHRLEMYFTSNSMTSVGLLSDPETERRLNPAVLQQNQLLSAGINLEVMNLVAQSYSV